MGIKINAMGVYIPEVKVTNDDFSKIVDTNDEWISTRTGIKSRYFVNGELTYQLGVKAAQDAFSKTDIKPEDIDLVIATTVTNDFLTPSLACLVARGLGIQEAPCMDVNCACSGFVYAVDIAQKYLLDDEIKNVLLISAEALSKISDYTDRSTCILFGDGAAACIISRSDSLYSSYLKSDTSGANKLFAKLDPMESPFSENKLNWEEDDAVFKDSKSNVLNMAGNDVYKFATAAMPLAVKEAAKKANIDISELDLIVPHQANIRIVQTAVKKLKLPEEKFIINVGEFGNTSSASVPIALNQAFEEGRIKPKDKVCLVGFGGGLTYGAVIIEI